MKKYQYTLAGLFAFIILLTGSELWAQSKKDAHKLEMIQADAYATSWVTCKMKLTSYQLSLKPDDKVLAKEEKDVAMTMLKMYNDMRDKYHANSADYKIFEREKVYGTKYINTCITYQKILDANAQSDKTKKK